MKMADSRSVKGEPSDKVCEVVEALVSFISGEWKHFGFFVFKIREKRKGDGQTN